MINEIIIIMCSLLILYKIFYLDNINKIAVKSVEPVKPQTKIIYELPQTRIVQPINNYFITNPPSTSAIYVGGHLSSHSGTLIGSPYVE